MSISEIERFAVDLKSNEALRAEAAKAPAETLQATPMDRVIAFAASKGYAFTGNDVKEYAKARELADAELDGVAGGISEGELEKFYQAMGETERGVTTVDLLLKTLGYLAMDLKQRVQSNKEYLQSVGAGLDRISEASGGPTKLRTQA